jgi:2-dehydro-3-deoxyphosphogluconate aldolase/(4S)-4-hydroxy-2-oxoglutarate aldolase
MNYQNGIEEILLANKKIPVVTFNSKDQVKLAIEQLEAASVTCIEITLRSDAAWEAIALCKKIVKPDFKVGVGTLVNVEQVSRCVSLDVDFLVSPGATSMLIDKMHMSGIPYLPGVMTPSEIISALEKDCRFLKLFPFNLAGGLAAVKTYASVFPKIKFCPTGGLNAKNYEEVLALNNVISVGGTWICEV